MISKFDTLSKVAYNFAKKKERTNMPKKIQTTRILLFEFLNNNRQQSHRCTLSSLLMQTRPIRWSANNIIMKNLNKRLDNAQWFSFQESISFVSGLIWYLKKKSRDWWEYLPFAPCQ